MKMACEVILFMMSLCWGSALHPAMETEILDDTQRGRSSVVQVQSCPTWYRETKNNAMTRCVCGATLAHTATLADTVMCNYANQETAILAGTCMSYDYSINDTVAGTCPFNYHYPDNQNFYVTLPNDTSELNSFMCGGSNRTGLLCSQCQPDLGPTVLSYTRQCVKCFDDYYGWLLYIMATLIPTTILCFLVIIFQIHITSPRMNAFVFLCQFIMCVNTLTNPYAYVHYASNLTAIHYFELAVITFYGIWNLDFFDTSSLHFVSAVT